MLGAALAVLGVVLAPLLVPFIFGDAYDDAVPVVQVMLLVLPFYFATEPLLVFAYAHGKERAVVIATLGLSFVGTALTFAGQLVGGAVLAAAGYVTRSLLLCAAAIVVSALVQRRREDAGAAEPHPMRPLSPQQS